MARWALPQLVALLDPVQDDVSSYTDIQSFTAANLPDVETPLDQSGDTLVQNGADVGQGIEDALSIGDDLDEAQRLLEEQSAQEDAETIADLVAGAVSLDSFLASL